MLLNHCHVFPEGLGKFFAHSLGQGAGRIIYGTDFPWNGYEQIKSDIEAINNLNITSDEKEKILGKNIERLIKSIKQSGR